jgi:hypothetical protein
MELRQLTTVGERQVFEQYLAKARATRGFGFRETGRSQVGRAHMAFGDLYGLFEGEGEPPEQMQAGFAVHDLAVLPQSFPKPDLSHLPPRYVLEGSELWSLSPGMGGLARGAAAAVAGLMQAKAIVIYAIVKPVDITHFYRPDGFVNVGETIEWPYAETTEGGKIWVQPLLLEGEPLEAYIRSGFDFLFRATGGGRILRSDRRPAPAEEHAVKSGASRSVAESRESVSTPATNGNRRGETTHA